MNGQTCTGEATLALNRCSEMERYRDAFQRERKSELFRLQPKCCTITKYAVIFEVGLVNEVGRVEAASWLDDNPFVRLELPPNPSEPQING